MSKVIFNFNQIKTEIHCDENETMATICSRYASKIQQDLKSIYFIYSGKTIDLNLPFKQVINKTDSIKKCFILLVYSNDIKSEVNHLINASQGICPKCSEIAILEILHCQIQSTCKKGHINNLKISEYENTQKIDESKIICDICKTNNKANAYKNTFFRCNNCKKNICTLCKISHDNSHGIIHYDDKNYICEEHSESYNSYCKSCNKNLCTECVKFHKSHEIVNYGNIVPDINELKNNLEEFRETKDNFNKTIRDIINKLETVMNNIEILYKINEDIVNKYIKSKSKRNYEVIMNINWFNSPKNNIIKEMKQIINIKNDNEEIEKILNIYDKMVYKENNTIIPIPGSNKLYTKEEEYRKLYIYQYPNISFSEEEKDKSINILFIGPIGVGKTTLINSFLNVLMGVTIDSNFRYVITSEKRSENNYYNPLTNDVYIYNIKANDGKLYQIIDTPGFIFDDINQNKIITEKIYKLFREKINFINVICLVEQSSNCRLTIGMKLTLHTILNLFGDNLKTNFITMLTFCDGGIPQFAEALKNFQSYSKIISYIEEPWYYKFNNSCFFSVDIKDFSVKSFWNLSYKNYESFIKRLEKLEKKNLLQTLELLSERRKLQDIVVNSYDKYILLLDKNIEYKKISISKSNKDSRKIKNEISDLKKECLESQDIITNSMNKINNIALNKFLFEDEYLELLIEGEKNERREGFKQRIQTLKILKDQLKFMKEIYENKNFFSEEELKKSIEKKISTINK